MNDKILITGLDRMCDAVNTLRKTPIPLGYNKGRDAVFVATLEAFDRLRELCKAPLVHRREESGGYQGFYYKNVWIYTLELSEEEKGAAKNVQM